MCFNEWKPLLPEIKAICLLQQNVFMFYSVRPVYLLCLSTVRLCHGIFSIIVSGNYFCCLGFALSLFRFLIPQVKAKFRKSSFTSAEEMMGFVWLPLKHAK